MGQLAEVGEQMRERQLLQEDQSERFEPAVFTPPAGRPTLQSLNAA